MGVWMIDLKTEQEYAGACTSLPVLRNHYHNILLHCFLITRCEQNYLSQMAQHFPTKNKLALFFFLSGCFATGNRIDYPTEDILYTTLINNRVTFMPSCLAELLPQSFCQIY